MRLGRSIFSKVYAVRIAAGDTQGQARQAGVDAFNAYESGFETATNEGAMECWVETFVAVRAGSNHATALAAANIALFDYAASYEGTLDGRC